MNKNEQVDLSIILPCYNEASHFNDSVKQILTVLERLDQKSEIIFVDDKSQDNTQQLIGNLINNFRHKKISLRKIFHEKNQGRGKTVTNGIKNAKGKFVGFLDIDLEVPAYYIPEFVSQLKKGADVVIGHRIYAMQLKSLHRWLMSRGYNFLVRKVLHLELSDTEAGYKFFEREKILPILDSVTDSHWFWDTEIVVRCMHAGLKIVEVPCLFLRRADKKSTVRLFKDSWDYLVKILKFKKKLDAEKFWQKTPTLFEEKYEKARFFEKFVTRFLDSRKRKIIPLLNIRRNELVLDIGCGSGVYLKEILDRNAIATGVDYSKETLELAKKRLAHFNNNRYRLIDAPAQKLPFENQSFDLVLAIGLLDYITETEKVLSEMFRVLRPDGNLIISAPKTISPFWFLRTSWGNFLRKKLLGLPPIIRWFSKQKLIEILHETGFTVEKINQVQYTMWIFKCQK